MEKKYRLKSEQRSKGIIDAIPFIPVMLNDAYSAEEPEYTTEDLIWKNPKYDPTR
jgi:hypothetical protein